MVVDIYLYLTFIGVVVLLEIITVYQVPCCSSKYLSCVYFFFKIMVLILNGDSEHVAHTWRKVVFSGEKNSVCDSSRIDQMPLTDHIKDIAPYVRTPFWVTI